MDLPLVSVKEKPKLGFAMYLNVLCTPVVYTALMPKNSNAAMSSGHDIL